MNIYKKIVMELISLNIQVNIPWQGQFLAGTVHYPSEFDTNNEQYPLIIICHGFVGSRVGVDRLFVKTSHELIQEQCVVLRFDYSGCGESEGEYGKTGLDALIDQTKAAIDFGLRLQKIDQNQLILLGHSLGGATAVLTATRDNRVKKLILWSSVGQPFKDIANIIGESEIAKLKESEFIDYLGYSLYKEFFFSLNKYTPLKEVKGFQGDVLLIHGSSDEDISVNYCVQYFEALDKNRVGTCQKKIIRDANHTFSSVSHFNELISTTRQWLSFQMTKLFVG